MPKMDCFGIVEGRPICKFARRNHGFMRRRRAFATEAGMKPAL